MLTYFVVAPIFLSVLLYLGSSRNWARIIAILSQTVLFVLSLQVFLQIAETDEIIRTPIGGYYGVMGVVLVADRLSSMFVMLTTFIFLIASVFSYRAKHSRLFWFLMFLWQSTMIGTFLSGDFFNIFVLTEIATITVTVLIMYNREKRSMYDGLIYMIINTVIIQFYLFGVGYLYMMTGSLDMNLTAERLAYIDRSNLILPYALIMTFVGLKCAMMPMYAWLPKAHGSKGAPSSVSAILSGLHIKSGIYLFLRFSDILQAINGQELFLVIGAITAITGVILAVAQSDIKLMLAYSTVAQVGLIIVGLNISYVGSYNYVGALYHIINHAVFKVALFLSAGIVVYSYNTRDINQIRGVLKKMPVVATAKILAILGIIGTPLFNGSISKYFLMAGLNWQLEAVLILVNMGTIIIFIKYSSIFFGKSDTVLDRSHHDPVRDWIVAFLGLLCFGLGIFGAQVIEFLFGYTVSIDFLGYIQKTIIFGVSFVAGYFIYKSMFTEENAFAYFLAWEKKAEMGFRGMCFSITAFFAFILIVVGFYN